MDMQNRALEAQADLLAEDALHELGNALPAEPDEYAKQCDFAGCYPWLEDVMCACPHDAVIHSVMYGGEVTDRMLAADSSTLEPVSLGHTAGQNKLCVDGRNAGRRRKHQKKTRREAGQGCA